MAKYMFLPLTSPVAGKEDEFNEWYDKHHLPDVINVPGILLHHTVSDLRHRRRCQPRIV